ncbi:CoA transferase [Arthrobacter sp. I2-34]|uniref:CoA transferase n=1 Tax=Arthrobacter hankyongi TaxID=2904801 RepID=A0ABS9L486_9MICC|nr:CoA transferase [Arthrobacter hankyongi]MCG2621299.1 CoA transferase [Arthrobacter hankyongi]
MSTPGLRGSVDAGPAGINGLRVLDLGTGLPTAVTVRLLAGAGAQVFRVDHPGREVFGQLYPALDWWNRGTRLVQAAEVAALLETVDVCLLGGEDHPDAVAALQLDAAELSHRHPRLVVLEIGGYVPGTPDTTPATDLLVQARTGFVFEQFNNRPVHIAFAPALYGSGLLGAMGVWAALLQRLRTGSGQLVRVSFQQALALFWQQIWLKAGQPDRDFDMFAPRDVRHLIFRCQDGDYVQLVLGVPGALGKVHRVLGIPGEVDPQDRGVPSLSRGVENYFADRGLLARYVARRRRPELIRALKDAGLAAEPVLPPGECFDDPQVVAAGLVERSAAGWEYGGNPINLGFTDPASSGRSTGEPDRVTDIGAAADAAETAPLAGIRIVDLGNWVAGPFASKLLADLGADVISVEPPAGLSNLTGIRNAWAANRGKRSIVVDLKSEDGQRTIRELVRTADAVHHNFRVGVAEGLGLGEDDLCRLRPDLVYLHTSAYGRSGPKAADSGFDMVMQALCGHEVRAGGEGNEPLWYRSPFIDYGAGALGAVGLLAGLYERAATGRAVTVHTSLLAAAVFLRGELARRPDGSVAGAPLLSRDLCGLHPAECLYQARDGWIAVAARGTTMRRRLGEALDIRLPADDAGWGPREQETIAAAVRPRSSGDVLAVLAAAGIWAVKCAEDAFIELLAGEANRQANLVITAPDGRYGHITGCFGPLISFSGWTPDPRGFRSAPLPDEHAAEILAELGLGSGPAAGLLNTTTPATSH